MTASEPLHVAFVWHMHQPYYRAAGTGAFEMPWARLHAIKDYLDMVEILSAYPDLHQTFNLVPSLVEQLEDYAAGNYVDVYWERTLKPAVDLDPAERAFVLERMCERPDHPRAASHARYLELARKREAHASTGWDACAGAFTTAELLDLQVWFNLAWFDPGLLGKEPLRDLVSKGRDFSEDDKKVIDQVQTGILGRTLPAYRDAARRGQIELSTSPYFHPILPLLINSDTARISSSDTQLPRRRFAHPEDAAEQIESALDKHERVFGERPRGMWCSEQAVGEDVIELLIKAGLAWTVSDETVLARSLSGIAPRRELLGSTVSAGTGTSAIPDGPYVPYRLRREHGEMAVVFRDHTLSDLIGFAYRSWDSHDAAVDLLRRLRELRSSLVPGPTKSPGAGPPPLVTIALDGENAWEYYPRDGRDFLWYLYEGLSDDPTLRCVTISEHLDTWRPTRTLDWLHTGSWIGGDLRTWSGERAHNTAWDLLHRARDRAAACRDRVDTEGPAGAPGDSLEVDPQAAAAWRHVLVAEGSDWFWWFGDHHHTELDHVWDSSFRSHLQEVYRSLGEPVPTELLVPILDEVPSLRPAPPRGEITPIVDGRADDAAEWEAAGLLAPDLPSTMQLAQRTRIAEVRFGWHSHNLCLLVVPGSSVDLKGTEVEIRVTRGSREDDPVIRLTLEEEGRVGVSCVQGTCLAGTVAAAWGPVLEVAIPVSCPGDAAETRVGLVVQIGRAGLTEHVFHSAGLASVGRGER